MYYESCSGEQAKTIGEEIKSIGRVYLEFLTKPVPPVRSLRLFGKSQKQPTVSVRPCVCVSVHDLRPPPRTRTRFYPSDLASYAASGAVSNGFDSRLSP